MSADPSALNATSRYILTVKCPDRKGIVAAIAGYLAENDASITESHHFDDAEARRFYMRLVFRPDGDRMPPLGVVREGFRPVAERFELDWALHDAAARPRVLIAVSKFGHCLHDLLHRRQSGALAIDVPVVVSNHEEMRSFTEWNGIPFVCVPNSAGKAAQEAKVLELAAAHDVDLVVLARYMQILSPQMCRALSGRCINIHHSFLPSFKGARPYHQAYARGVKIIGATAHYVTTDLDEGPIIEQDVQRVHHEHTPESLVGLGRDVECRVLARAVRWHAEHRVLIEGSKTVVFA
jgi:formyltetrahydrofolate deformylase